MFHYLYSYNICENVTCYVEVLCIEKYFHHCVMQMTDFAFLPWLLDVIGMKLCGFISPISCHQRLSLSPTDHQCRLRVTHLLRSADLMIKDTIVFDCLIAYLLSTVKKYFLKYITIILNFLLFASRINIEWI